MFYFLLSGIGENFKQFFKHVKLQHKRDAAHSSNSHTVRVRVLVFCVYMCVCAASTKITATADEKTNFHTHC